MDWINMKDKLVAYSSKIPSKKKLGDAGASWSATAEWVEKWKTWYGNWTLNVCGEKLSADPNTVDIFKIEFLLYDSLHKRASI